MSLKVIEHISNKRILFSPLNWGLGHVSRSIPILEKLINQGNELFVACDRNQRRVFDEYFPKLQYVDWKGYPFQFSGKGNFTSDLFRSFPKLLVFGRREKQFVEQFCQSEKIDILLSDHRYFFQNKKTKSIFITHQISLPLPWYLKLGQQMHIRLVNKFDEIWILDNEDHHFAGKLSKGRTKARQLFLGPVSRFVSTPVSTKSGTLILISGPEPYASQFYRDQKSKLKQNEKIVYQGRIETINSSEKITWKDLDKELLQAEKLISRSGYSTIMDAYFLKCDTVFYPTKGQKEQEYLAEL
jgi:hypothetical protein